MTKSESYGATEAKDLCEQSPKTTHLTATTRIDPPHEARTLGPEQAVAEQTPVSKPVADQPANEQIRLQADQLATHLRDRQTELDHREAELNSRIARWESDTRAARLWSEQREFDLVARAEEMTVREQEVEQRLARLAAAEAAQQKREPPAAKRPAVDQEIAAMRAQLSAEHRQAMADLDQKRQAVRRRADHVDQCRAALTQLRSELGHMHRETLEIRLATEELWVQLSGAAPPAALTRSLGRIRTKLAQQYRQANAELADQRKELETIRGQLLEQHETLAMQKRRFELWATSRQEELEQQASRLVAREQQIEECEETAVPA